MPVHANSRRGGLPVPVGLQERPQRDQQVGAVHSVVIDDRGEHRVGDRIENLAARVDGEQGPPGKRREVQWQTAAFGRRRRKPRIVDCIDEIVERMRAAESDADQPPCGAAQFGGQPPDELGTFAAR